MCTTPFVFKPTRGMKWTDSRENLYLSNDVAIPPSHGNKFLLPGFTKAERVEVPSAPVDQVMT